jgi:hypothetical protein
MQFEPHHLSAQLWVSNPEDDGVFRLGVSVLGGDDVLGDDPITDLTTGYAFDEFIDYVTEINIDNGVNLTGVIDSGGGVTTSIILSAQFDPLENRNFRMGNAVKIGLKDYVHGRDFVPFFYGIATQVK